MIIYTIMIVGGLLSVITVLLVEPIMWAAGASELLIDDCISYGAVLLAGSVPFMLQTSFQNFFVVSERPMLGLVAFPYCPGSPIWFWIMYLLQFWAWGSLVQALLQ